MYLKKDLGYKYPDRSDEHMITVKHLRDIIFDINYPYLDKSLWFKIKRVGLWILLNPFIFLVCTIRHGVKIYGRKNLRKHKELLKNGAITIANHVFMWDYICVLKAIRPRLQHLIAWKTNLEGPNGPLIRLVGGIPVPTGNIRSMCKFKEAVDEVLESGKWLHVYPEGSMWFYYPDIRPLKPAVFRFAVDHNKPIVPIVFTFRERKGIFKIFSKNPFVDVHIGEPMLPDLTLSKKDATDKMHKEAYHIMQLMAGIKETDPNYNTNQNIDEYVKTL